MPTIHEKFVKWYLRFNAYFTIDSFVVHAADDTNRIRDGIVAPHTEVDIIAVRMPYSVEMAGNLRIANHKVLVGGQNERFDVVIAEVKSGNNNRPNSIWRNKNLEPIRYVIRFVGLLGDQEIEKAVKDLSERYYFESEKVRIRYIIFAYNQNPHYFDLGVNFITFSEMVDFLVEERGQCWIKSGIGVSSVHYQWDDQINEIFGIVNNFSKSPDERKSAILQLLKSESEQ